MGRWKQAAFICLLGMRLHSERTSWTTGGGSWATQKASYEKFGKRLVDKVSLEYLRSMDDDCSSRETAVYVYGVIITSRGRRDPSLVYKPTPSSQWLSCLGEGHQQLNPDRATAKTTTQRSFLLCPQGCVPPNRWWPGQVEGPACSLASHCIRE